MRRLSAASFASLYCSELPFYLAESFTYMPVISALSADGGIFPAFATGKHKKDASHVIPQVRRAPVAVCGRFVRGFVARCSVSPERRSCGCPDLASSGACVALCRPVAALCNGCGRDAVVDGCRPALGSIKSTSIGTFCPTRSRCDRFALQGAQYGFAWPGDFSCEVSILLSSANGDVSFRAGGRGGERHLPVDAFADVDSVGTIYRTSFPRRFQRNCEINEYGLPRRASKSTLASRLS